MEETNKKTIYIVTSGDYSDFHISAVFSTKGKAEEYVQQNGSDYNIEEFDLDEEVQKVSHIWQIEFDINTGEMREALPYYYFQCVEKLDTCTFDSYVGVSVIRFFVEADSMNRGIKIARERFNAIKSNEYILQRLTRPYGKDAYGLKKYEIFNIKTNEFIKNKNNE